jgi:hypothetical protein
MSFIVLGLYCQPQSGRDRASRMLAGFAFVGRIDSQWDVLALLSRNMSRTAAAWQYMGKCPGTLD